MNASTGGKWFRRAGIACALWALGCDDGGASAEPDQAIADATTADLGTAPDQGMAPDEGVTADRGASMDAGPGDAGAGDAAPIEVDMRAAPDQGVALDATLDQGASLDLGAPDQGAPDQGGPDQGAPAVIRGVFESTGPVRGCGMIATSNGPAGHLLRLPMNLCGDDIDALIATIVANLDDLARTDRRALLALIQGTNVPQAWLDECETYTLEDPRFSGELCLPWDANYQARLGATLAQIGAAVGDHPGLAGVYFTAPTMTNGVEMHFRVLRSAFPAEPAPGALVDSYVAMMDLWQGAFARPILFEAGHCLFFDPPGGAEEPIDCAPPLAMYRHARDTYGRDQIGIALWNCAERFWSDPADREGALTREIIEEATADGVSIGCQTVGSFTRGACRFSDPDVGDYGDRAGLQGDMCPESASFDPEAACVDTLGWFAGGPGQAATSPIVGGTWGEIWSRDLSPAGVYSTSPACAAAIDALAP